MRLSIIGAGRVGQALGHMARLSGHEIGEVVCRTRRSAVYATRFIGGGAPLGRLRAELSPADLILISTPDDRIEEAVKIIEANAARAGRAVVLHTSGALASSVLSPLLAHRFSTGSCHPLQSFESPARGVELVQESFFCIEGQRRAVRMARSLVEGIGARHFEIPTRMKGLYHAAAVLASGGVVALLDISLKALARCGLSETEATRVLLPLVEGTVGNVRAVGPGRALTGPVRRGDARTVSRNLEALNEADADGPEIYRLLARRAVLIARRAGVDGESLDRVVEIID